MIRDAVASALEHFDFIVEPLYESTRLAIGEIIGDFVHACA